MPESFSARRHPVRVLSGRHRGVRLTGRELNLGGYPSPPDLTPPRTRLDSPEQPPGLAQPTGTEGVGRETEQGVRPGTERIDAVRITAVRGLNACERQAVERAGEVMSPELAVVRRAGGEGKGRDHRVGVVTERIQHGRGGGVVALAAEDDGSEPPNTRVGRGER
ncbi:hypothetical protein GCM10027200_61580 [Lentzea nigeriaca]